MFAGRQALLESSFSLAFPRRCSQRCFTQFRLCSAYQAQSSSLQLQLQLSPRSAPRTAHPFTSFARANPSLPNSSSALVATSTPHTSLIRHLVAFTDSSTSTTYLISTGEDKLLVVSSLPTLETLSTRELVKRANALSITAEGEIVVGDKFGDVYTFVASLSSPRSLS